MRLSTAPTTWRRLPRLSSRTASVCVFCHRGSRQPGLLLAWSVRPQPAMPRLQVKGSAIGDHVSTEI